MRDYGKRYSGAMATRQNVVGRRSVAATDGEPSRIVGAVAVAAMLLGVVGSLWFGAALRDNLGRLDKGKQEKIQLTSLNAALLAEKENQLSRENFAASAEKFGLFPPAENQLRRP